MYQLTTEQINKLYELLDEIPPENIHEHDISELLCRLEKKLTPHHTPKCNLTDIKNKKKVLVADDLEVSLLQLTKLLSKSGYDSFVARNYAEALDNFKKQDLHCVFLDLFFPDAEDGLKLLEEIKNSQKTIDNDIKIIIISGTDDKKLINKCFEKGAFDFITKSQDWHIKVLNVLRKLDELKRGPVPEIKTFIENEEKGIASIKIKNLFKSGVVDDLKRETLNLANSGCSNLILDFENINSTNPEILNIIVQIFKTCRQNNGCLKLCNTNKELTESLSFVFLDGVIPTFNNKEEAIDDFDNCDCCP